MTPSMIMVTTSVTLPKAQKQLQSIRWKYHCPLKASDQTLRIVVHPQAFTLHLQAKPQVQRFQKLN